MLKLGRKRERLVVERAVRPCAPSGQAIQRGIRRPRRLRLNEVENALGLIVVEPSVQERALRELAASRQPRAGGQAGLQDATRRDRAAVALELDHVLARIGLRRPERKHDRLVNHAAPRRAAVGRPLSFVRRRVDLAKIEAAPRHGRAGQARGDGQRLRPGDANDRHAGRAGGGRNGSYRQSARHFTLRKNLRISSAVVHCASFS